MAASATVPAGQRPRVAIIGSGFSGLCLAIRLQQTGAASSFTLLEKGDRLGGTWRDNTYPGAACDLMSFAYCFSFEQKTDWTRKWSPQPEILAYMDHCAEKYGILPHVRFGTEVTGARFDAAAGVWRIQILVDGKPGREIEADVLVSGVGQLHRPVVPKIPGLDSFEGDWFHSAEWDHDVLLAGRRVGVVGNGASAIQFIPELAPRVEALEIFQRTPNWITPRGDRPYSDSERRRFARVPGLARLYRWLIWARQELLFSVMVGNRFFSERSKQLALENLHAHIRDPELRRALTPDYPIGGKRLLIHDDYYPALARDNVELVTSAIDHIEPREVVTVDGRRHPLDVLILGTGFDTNSFLAPMAIEGLAGRSLEQEWKTGAEAYLGLAVSGFPNLFLMYGPNTNLGHNSIIFMIECQANYIVKCLKRLSRRGLRYLDVREDVQRDFNRDLHRALARTAWAKTPKSWYKTEDGKITNNWSGTTTAYWWRTRRPDWDAFHHQAR
ncbi:MAG: NAD(P)/FAD-dependent oxidoreductase [Proteobacteria bacterium]|nr:NAD(P)/FAD-dependent oxidoreductase [Pseudomonadota bacterium]